MTATAAASANPDALQPRPWIAGLDCALFTLADTDRAARVVAQVLLGNDSDGEVVSHWVDNAPGIGGSHTALTVQLPTLAGSGGAARRVRGDGDRVGNDDQRWARLRLAAMELVDQGIVFAEPDEIGLVMPGRQGGLPHLVAAATAAIEAHRARTSGRAIVFHGSALLTGSLTVAQLVASTAIDEVRGVADTQISHDTTVHTFGFTRPTFQRGLLVLPVVPCDGGVAPFEVASPTPCCNNH